MNRLLRMARRARHPPSGGHVAFVLAIVLVCLMLVGIEHLWGWPDWLTVNRRYRPRGFRP